MSKRNETETPATAAPAKGPRILKYGLLAADASVKITGAAKIGNFGKYDVPFDLDGQHFILPLSAENPQFDALRVAFGDPAEWTGCTIRVSDGKVLKQVNVSPVADAAGKPVN